MNKNILRIAIPNIISNITVPLLGMVDIAIVGHLDSELYIGAIALSTMIFNFIFWNFSFLRMGTSGFTAQAYGAENKQEQIDILIRSLALAVAVSIIIISLQYFIFQIAFFFLEADSQIKTYAAGYFYIYIWATPAILGMYAFTGWFVGMQNSKTPMYIALFVNTINILLSLLCVYVLKMKLDGVALASTLAQMMGFGLTVIIWRRKYKIEQKLIRISILKDRLNYLPFFRVNRDIFLRTLCLIAVTTFFTSTSSKMGNTILSVNTLIMQLFMLFSFMMDGFAYAAEALTGRYIGAKQPSLLPKLIKRLFAWGITLSIVFTIAYGLLSDQLFTLLTNKQEIIDSSKQYHLWVLLIPIASFAAFLWDGIFIGATASREMRNSMFFAIICFFITYYSTQPIWANNALWLAFIVYLASRAIIQTFLFKKIRRQL